METLMLVLFLLGAGYAALSLFLGDWLGFDFQPGELPFLSPTVIATFLTVFGGVGYVLLNQTGWSVFPVAGLSLLVASGVSLAVLFLVVMPLQAAQTGTAPSAKSMLGFEAEVVISIEPSRLGEIVYMQGGTRHSAPAKSADGSAIPQGAGVRIVGETAGTFIVENRETARLPQKGEIV
jgi:hypothetical protein